MIFLMDLKFRIDAPEALGKYTLNQQFRILIGEIDQIYYFLVIFRLNLII